MSKIVAFGDLEMLQSRLVDLQSISKTHCTFFESGAKMGPKTMYDFWSNWPPKLTLEVVPLKCVSRQQKTPYCFFFQNASGCGRKTKHTCNSQNYVREKLARAPSMRTPFFPKGSGRTRRTVHSEPRNYSQKLPRAPSMSATVSVHRPHSTPSMQIPFFPKGSGRTVHSEPRNYS